MCKCCGWNECSASYREIVRLTKLSAMVWLINKCEKVLAAHITDTSYLELFLIKCVRQDFTHFSSCLVGKNSPFDADEGTWSREVGGDYDLVEPELQLFLGVLNDWKAKFHLSGAFVEQLGTIIRGFEKCPNSRNHRIAWEKLKGEKTVCKCCGSHPGVHSVNCRSCGFVVCAWCARSRGFLPTFVHKDLNTCAFTSVQRRRALPICDRCVPQGLQRMKAVS